MTIYILILIKQSSLKSILSVLLITYNPIELIIAKMDKFETTKSIRAALNHRLSMNLLYLTSNLLNHQILTWKAINTRKNINKTKRLKLRSSTHDICVNIDGKYSQTFKVELNHVKNLKLPYYLFVQSLSQTLLQQQPLVTPYL